MTCVFALVGITDDELLCRSPEVGAVRSRSNYQQPRLCTESISAAGIGIDGWHTQVVGHERRWEHDKDAENQLHSILRLPVVARCHGTRNRRQLSFSKYHTFSAVNPSWCKGSYSATSNDTKLVH